MMKTSWLLNGYRNITCPELPILYRSKAMRYKQFDDVSGNTVSVLAGWSVSKHVYYNCKSDKTGRMTGLLTKGEGINVAFLTNEICIEISKFYS